MARIVVIVLLAVLAAMPAAAPAASSQSLLQDTATQQAPAPVQQAPTTQTQANGGSLGARDLLLVALGIGALIGGIWFVIARDARRATAGRVRSSDGELGGGRGGSATRSARRSRKLSAAEKQRRRRGRAH
ncbi:MAG TPA: hypothetical protein VFF79_11940 [Conexibacter sp.]|jgi:hypothetical protein|nr:hypothetical protein [Conexibacter sp.]